MKVAWLEGALVEQTAVLKAAHWVVLTAARSVATRVMPMADRMGDLRADLKADLKAV